MLNVHCAVQTGSLNKTDCISSLNDKWLDCYVLMVVWTGPVSAGFSLALIQGDIRRQTVAIYYK